MTVKGPRSGGDLFCFPLTSQPFMDILKYIHKVQRSSCFPQGIIGAFLLRGSASFMNGDDARCFRMNGASFFIFGGGL